MTAVYVRVRVSGTIPAGLTSNTTTMINPITANLKFGSAKNPGKNCELEITAHNTNAPKSPLGGYHCRQVSASPR